MRKYIRIYKKLIDIGVSFETQYRKDTWLSFVVQSIQLITALLFIEAVYSQVHEVPGWGRGELFMLPLMVNIQNRIFILLFQRNFNEMEQLIHSGKFDALLTIPVSPLFYATNRIIRVRALTMSAMELCTFFVIAVYFQLPISLAGFVRGSFMMFWGIVVMYAVSLTLNCFLFRNSQIGNVNNILGELRYQGRYPFSIFPQKLYAIFTTIMPVAFFGYFAAAALFHKLSILAYVYVPIFAMSTLAFSIFLWRKQITHYSSASS